MSSRTFNSNLFRGTLDLYLYDDPELELATFDNAIWGVESAATLWAVENNVTFKFHVQGHRHRSSRSRNSCGIKGTDDILRAVTDLIFDSDEVLMCWDGEDEDLQSLFDIAVQQEKPQLILISNDEIELAIHEAR